MYVKNKMITDVITVFPDASISLAFQIMHEKNVSQLPVVKNGKLVGMVTEKLLAEFTPSKATTLSMYELNYVLGKTKVDSIMAKDLLTCQPDMLIETVAGEMNSSDVNMIPVVLEDQTLVGVISRSDIIEAFLEIIGAKDKGTRMTIEVPDKAGSLADIANIIKEHGVNITHITNFNNTVEGISELIIRLNTQDIDDMRSKLESMGYKVIRIDQK